MRSTGQGYILSVASEFLPHQYRHLGGRVWLVSPAIAAAYARVMGVGKGEEAFAVATDPSLLIAALSNTLREGISGRVVTQTGPRVTGS
jgi:hypothetical protein